MPDRAVARLEKRVSDWLRSDHVPQQHEPPAPPRIATLFRVIGKSNRPIRCATYQTATGVELRLEYEDRIDDVLQSVLFRGEQQDQAIAAKSAEWRSLIDARGGSARYPTNNG